MQINIRLPRPVDIENDSYEGVKSFLKQLELAVHHAQKSLQEMANMEKERGNSEPTFGVLYRPLNVEDSSTGVRADLGEHPSSDDVEIEVYTM